MRGYRVNMLLLAAAFVARTATAMNGANMGGCDAQLKPLQQASLFEEQDKSVTTLLLQSGLEIPAAGEINVQPFEKLVSGAYEPTVANMSTAINKMKVGLYTLVRHPEKASSMVLLEQSSQVYMRNASATVPILIVAIALTLLVVATAATWGCYRFRFDKDASRGDSRHYKRMKADGASEGRRSSVPSLMPYEVPGSGFSGGSDRSNSNVSFLGVPTMARSRDARSGSINSSSSENNTHSYVSSQSPASDASSVASGEVMASNSILVQKLLPWISDGGCLEIHGHFPIPKLYARIVSKLEGRFVEIATTPQWLTPHVGFGPLLDSDASPRDTPIKAFGPTREMFGELKIDGGKMSIVSNGFEIFSFREGLEGEPWLAKFRSRSGSTMASVWLTATKESRNGTDDEQHSLLQFCIGSGIDNALIIACMLGAVVSFPFFGQQLKALQPRIQYPSSESSFTA